MSELLKVNSNIKVITQPVTEEQEIREKIVKILDLNAIEEPIRTNLIITLEQLCDLQSRINFLESVCTYDVFTEKDRISFSKELEQRYSDQKKYTENALAIIESLN